MKQTFLALMLLALSACAAPMPTLPTPVTTPSPPSYPPGTVIVANPTPTPSPTPGPQGLLQVELLYTQNGNRVSFGMSESGGAVTSVWSFGDGASATTAPGVPGTSHVYTPGVWLASVTITDAFNRTVTSDPVSINVAAPPVPTPTPTPGPTPTPSPTPTPIPVPMLLVTLGCPVTTTLMQACNVSATYGGLNLLSTAITGVAWDWGDGTTSATFPLGSRGYAQAGTYLVTATVTASTVDGPKTASASKSVVIP
jgi:hypothetical protein